MSTICLFCANSLFCIAQWEKMLTVDLAVFLRETEEKSRNYILPVRKGTQVWPGNYFRLRSGTEYANVEIFSWMCFIMLGVIYERL